MTRRKERVNPNERVALVVTRLTTSMWFLYGLVLFVALWMEMAPGLRLDTAPAYPVMLYWVNLFQALMLPVLAVGQAVLSRSHEKRDAHEARVVDALGRMEREQAAKLDALASGVRTLAAQVDLIAQEVVPLGRRRREGSHAGDDRPGPGVGPGTRAAQGERDLRAQPGAPAG